MVSINWMNECINHADTTQPPRQASPATPPQEGNVPTLCLVQIRHNRLRRVVLVSINRVNECINRADQRVTGGHISPPLQSAVFDCHTPRIISDCYRFYYLLAFNIYNRYVVADTVRRVYSGFVGVEIQLPNPSADQ